MQENKHLLAEIKEINNRFIDCEVIIDEKDNIEQPFGIATEQTEGLVIKIIFNAVSISQNLVYEFTTDKKVNDFKLCFELFILIILIFISLIM